MTVEMFNENDRELMRRTFIYQWAILAICLKIVGLALLSFIPLFKTALVEVEAEKSLTEKYPERLLGWK